MKEIYMDEGLFGFEEYHNYSLCSSDYDPFMWLHCNDEKAVSFLVVDPFIFRPDYEIDIDDDYLKKIGISQPQDVIIMAVVTVPVDGSPVTANLRGPLVINKINGKAMQVILNDSKWSTKHDILQESLENSKKGSCQC